MYTLRYTNIYSHNFGMSNKFTQKTTNFNLSYEYFYINYVKRKKYNYLYTRIAHSCHLTKMLVPIYILGDLAIYSRI